MTPQEAKGASLCLGPCCRSSSCRSLFCHPLFAQLPCPENSLEVLGCPVHFAPLNLGWPCVKILLKCNIAFIHLYHWHLCEMSQGRIADWKFGGEAWWFCMVALSPKVCVCLRHRIQPRAALNRGNPSILLVVFSYTQLFTVSYQI